MAGRSAGEIKQFADQVKRSSRWFKTSRTSGILDALTWTLGDKKRHPITGKLMRKPPNMRAVREAAVQAKAALGDNKLNPKYYKAMRECLTWIDGSNSRRPRL